MRESKVKEFSLGRITYRLPNVIESMRLLGKMGFDTTGVAAGQSELVILSNFIEHLEPFIVSVEAKKGDEVIDSWEAALEHFEFVAPLSEIAGEIMSAFQGGDEKATKRKKR